MVDVALDYGLQQLVDKPTRGENILDLFFTNSDSLVQHVNVKPGISGHDYVEIMCDIKPARVISLLGKFSCGRKPTTKLSQMTSRQLTPSSTHNHTHLVPKM